MALIGIGASSGDAGLILISARRRLACTRSQFPLWTDSWLLNLLDSAKQDQKADDAENENGTRHQEIGGK